MENERKIPTHVAIIMDGNGRWAKKRGLPRTMGHIQGGKVPDAEFVAQMQGYVRQLENHIADCIKVNKSDTHIPDWAHKLMRDRYGMNLHG